MILNIDFGTLSVTFKNLDENIEMTPEREDEIIEKLKNGEYVIGLATKEVIELPTFEKVATFDFTVDSAEYTYWRDDEDNM